MPKRLLARFRRRPWPAAEDCEPLAPLARRVLPFVPSADLPDMPRSNPPDPLDRDGQPPNSGWRVTSTHTSDQRTASG